MSVLCDWWQRNLQKRERPVPPDSPALAAALQTLADAYLIDTREDDFRKAAFVIGNLTHAWESFARFAKRAGATAPEHPDASFCAKHTELVCSWMRHRAARQQKPDAETTLTVPQKGPPLRFERVPDDVWRNYERDRHARDRGFDNHKHREQVAEKQRRGP